MKFDLVSDLHLDHWTPGDPIDWARKTSDVLVVAGDISDDWRQSAAVLRELAQRYKQVIFLDGNHEHVLTRFDDLDAPQRGIEAALAGVPNIHFLWNGPKVVDGCAFVGRNGWWDFKIAEPQNPAALSWAYFKDAIDGRGEDGQAVCQRIAARALQDRAAIASEVAAMSADPAVRDIFVVTHTLPHGGCLSWGVYPPRAISQGCYGDSGVFAAVKAADGNGKVRGWGFGHNHHSRDERIEGVRCVSHPRGRPLDFNRRAYAPKPIDTAAPPPMAQPNPKLLRLGLLRRVAGMIR